MLQHEMVFYNMCRLCDRCEAVDLDQAVGPENAAVCQRPAVNVCLFLQEA